MEFAKLIFIGILFVFLSIYLVHWSWRHLAFPMMGVPFQTLCLVFAIFCFYKASEIPLASDYEAVEGIMSHYTSYGDVVPSSCYRQPIVKVTEHTDYKTVRIVRPNNRVLVFNLFPDFSYRDVRCSIVE